ncbi:hypothetical protein BDV38DRAFT_139181 [Aspergillus pseudotamarii]|uniref:Uncharacterized protein n=1 Tax=Aspergillus pseudotamarii TaxID=132259 RepID=A0A5N6SLK2_ASPPS|nr:uncharacterized protein BDV38DRAFT_139181 [Aspergillus pseudotamarii]KAE8135435.1 hypothetical protein BDV38DRAFT_139181 [Aspergillus pseudotamarii]
MARASGETLDGFQDASASSSSYSSTSCPIFLFSFSLSLFFSPSLFIICRSSSFPSTFISLSIRLSPHPLSSSIPISFVQTFNTLLRHSPLLIRQASILALPSIVPYRSTSIKSPITSVSHLTVSSSHHQYPGAISFLNPALVLLDLLISLFFLAPALLWKIVARAYTCQGIDLTLLLSSDHSFITHLRKTTGSIFNPL